VERKPHLSFTHSVGPEAEGVVQSSGVSFSFAFYYPNVRLISTFISSDQLWTNNGHYKPPAPGQEYPIDLEGYPDYGQGWMNEDGVRIDMGHHRIPKVPLRSALKGSKN
jgi:hypothetical protein